MEVIEPELVTPVASCGVSLISDAVIEAEKETNDSDTFSWKLIQHKPEWQQSLARTALSCLVVIIRNNISNSKPIGSIRSAFQRWHISCLSARSEQQAMMLDESNKQIAALEQRSVIVF